MAPEVARIGDAVDGDEERRPLRPIRRARSSRSASWSGAALASTPCGASLRASASRRLRLTSLHGHPQVGGQIDDVGEAAGRPSSRWRPTARAPCAARPAGARGRPADPRPARRRGLAPRAAPAAPAVRPRRRRSGHRRTPAAGRTARLRSRAAASGPWARTVPERPPAAAHRQRATSARLPCRVRPACARPSAPQRGLPPLPQRRELGASRAQRRTGDAVEGHSHGDDGDGPAGDALAATERAEALGPPALHRHRRAGRAASGCAPSRRGSRRQLRRPRRPR